MPSSTSSSDTSGDRAPGGPWGRTWLVASLVAVVALATVEAGKRALGHRPSVVDDEAQWCLQRDRLEGEGESALALLGTSKAQMGLCGQTLSERLPSYTIAQLAKAGTHPLAALTDLADDPDFRGTVVCELIARSFTPGRLHSQQAVVEFHRRRWTTDQSINAALGGRLEQASAAVSPLSSVRAVASSLLDHQQLPDPPFVVQDHRRFMSADFTRIDLDEYRARRLRLALESHENEVAPSAEEWLAVAQSFEPAVDRIRQRGGEVVFTVFPVSPERAAIDEQHFPRTEYWDRFARSTAAHTLHWNDVPTLRGFECPDTMHLDTRDTAAFTGALLDELQRRGLLPEPPPR